MDQKVQKVRVSVPMCTVGSRIDFRFTAGVAVIRIPFEALDEAETVRQRAFRVVAYYGGATEWTYNPQDRRLEGSLELDSAEIRTIEELADRLATLASAAA